MSCPTCGFPISEVVEGLVEGVSAQGARVFSHQGLLSGSASGLEHTVQVGAKYGWHARAVYGDGDKGASRAAFSPRLARHGWGEGSSVEPEDRA